LTRLPSSHRLAPDEAFRILEESWAPYPTVSLSANLYWRVLRDAGSASIAGGLIYDALIAATARRGGAQVLLTWNVEHFARFSHGNLEVVSPSRKG